MKMDLQERYYYYYYRVINFWSLFALLFKKFKKVP